MNSSVGDESRQIVSRAMDLAAGRNERLTTLHLLLAFCDAGGMAGGILNRSGVTVEAIRPLLKARHPEAPTTIDRLKEAGAQDIRFLCLLAAPEGVKAVAASHPDVRIFTAAVDDRLDENGYIVPGLGDAGDRMYGTK